MSGVGIRARTGPSNVVALPRRDGALRAASAHTKVLYAVTDDDGLVEVAPVLAALGRRSRVRQVVVHAGRSRLAEVGPSEGLTAVHHALGIPAGGHAERTAATLLAFDGVLREEQPDVVVVAGDQEEALAAAIAAAKLQIAISHLRSGMRSFDWTQSEEINGRLIDDLADTLFTYSADADANLLHEGIPEGRIHRVGNPRIDVMRQYEATARRRAAWGSHGAIEGGYTLVALRRPASLEPLERLRATARSLAALAAEGTVLLVDHAATRAAFDDAVTANLLEAAGVRRVEAAGYLELLSLEAGAAAIITDAATLQEEASALGIPCYTPLAMTASTVTLTHGTNILLGDDPAAISGPHLPRHSPTPAAIPLWDGRAGERVAAALLANYTLARSYGQD
jgi:UDP-N-acetylglucosamine 2-epimerase (non-hydrolysing)